MKAWTRWQDWVTVLLGIALFLAPWILGTVLTSAFTLNAWFIGVIAVAVALFSLSQPRRFVTEWITLILGGWLLISPWLFAFAPLSGATWTAWIIGLLLIVTSGWTLIESQRPHAQIPV